MMMKHTVWSLVTASVDDDDVNIILSSYLYIRSRFRDIFEQSADFVYAYVIVCLF